MRFQLREEFADKEKKKDNKNKSRQFSMLIQEQEVATKSPATK